MRIRMDDNIAMTVEGQILCVHCGWSFAVREESFLKRAVKKELVPHAAGPHIREEASVFVDQVVILRQYNCPGCYTALHTEIVPKYRMRYSPEKSDAVRGLKQ